MTPNEEFEKAKRTLSEELEKIQQLRMDIFGQFNRLLSSFDTSSIWAFLFELVQNAVDGEAKNISFSLDEEDNLNFQHDGKKPLSQGDVEGLCGFSLSTKGLNTVGFMGLGFKSFTRFFERVEISHDGGIRFSVEAPSKRRSNNPDLKKLYQPEWLDQEPTLDSPMTTRFTFVSPKDNTIQSIKAAHENIEPISLAVFGARDLQTITFLDKKYSIAKIKNIENIFRVLMEGEDDTEQYHYLMIVKERNLSEDAILQLMDSRNLTDEDLGEIPPLKRDVRLLKEVDYSSDEQGTVSIIPKSMRKGKMFCLVRLGDNFPFPFKIGIDTEWILAGISRQRLERQDRAGDWHRELLEMVPELIRDYLDSMPNSITPENRKEWLDVFPDSISREDYPGLEFLQTNDFKELMKESLSDCKFVLCADGEVRSPTDVSDLPKNPGMSDSAYTKFAQDCFECHILDTKSLMPSTLRYLKSLGFLTFPEEDVFKVKKIRDFWKPIPDSSFEHYKHILDMLYQLISNEDEDEGQTTGGALGPAVVPTSKDDEWGRLVDPQLAFRSIPNEKGIERPLWRLLIEEHPEFKDAKVVHSKLKAKIKGSQYNRNSWEPGYRWKSNAIEAAIDVKEKLKSLDVPNDDETYVLANYRYALRANLPSIVTHLHNATGCKPVNECLIGPPLGHELMEKIAPDQLLSDKFIKVPRISRDQVLKFLEKAGAVSLVPTKVNTQVLRPEATKFAGSEPTKSSVAGNKKDKGLKGGYTTHDWVWPLKLSDISDQDALSDYLSKPDERLKEAIKNADRRRKLTYFFGSPKTHRSRINSTWITDFKELAWVLCVDKILRKPIETAGGSAAPDVLEEEIIEFYTKHGIAFGEDIPTDLNERLEFWRSTPASRNQIKFSETLRELANPENYPADNMDIPEELGEVLWGTKSGGTPLRRFIRKPSSELGGFVGDWDLISWDICSLLEEIGLEPPDSITREIATEFIENVREKYDDTEIDETTRDNLRHANSVILGGDNSDLGNCSFLTYDGSWVKPSDVKCLIQLTHDANRFEELSDRLLHPGQLPSRKEELRDLYGPNGILSLLDNEMKLLTTFSTQNETETNLRRLIDSLGLDFRIRYTDDNQLRVRFEDNELDTPYLVKDDEGEIKIYLSADKIQWVYEIALFIVAQSETTSSSDLIESVRKCLESSSDDFEKFYNKLSKLGLEMVEPREVEHGEAEPEESGNKDKGPTPLSPVEITKTSPIFNDDEDSDEETEVSRKSTSERKPKKKSEKKIPTVVKPVSEGDRKRQPRTDKETVQMVTNHLREEGWEPLDKGARLRMHNNQDGFDIQAVKENIILRVEVKGRKAKWGESNVSISRKQMQHAFTFHGEEHMGKYVADYRLAVIEESESEPKVRLISFMDHDFDFVFRRSDFPKDEDATPIESEEE